MVSKIPTAKSGVPIKTIRNFSIISLYMRCFGKGIQDRKSTRLNSSHVKISYAVFCLKKKISWESVSEDHKTNINRNSNGKIQNYEVPINLEIVNSDNMRQVVTDCLTVSIMSAFLMCS